MSDAFKPLLGRLADGQTLTEPDAEAFFGACLRGEPSPAAARLVGSAQRGLQRGTDLRLVAEGIGRVAQQHHVFHAGLHRA